MDDRLLVLNTRLKWSASANKRTAVAVAECLLVVATLGTSLETTATKHLLPTSLPARSVAMISDVSRPLELPTSRCPLDLRACLALAAAVVAGTSALEATWYVAEKIAEPAAEQALHRLERRKIRRRHLLSMHSGMRCRFTCCHLYDTKFLSFPARWLVWKTETT
jgi:hypothetical protein